MPNCVLDRRAFLGTSLAALGTGLLANRTMAADTERPNVLFIAIDDLRPQLGCYGHGHIHTPNIERLASEGLLFERAYCQQAICMSSRASLLSGYRPDKGQIFRNGPLYKHVPDALPINRHFLDNGYEAVTMGKIYHHRSDEKQGWSKEGFHPEGDWQGRGYLTDEGIQHALDYNAAHPGGKKKGLGPAFEAADVPDNAYPDGITAEHAVKELNRLKDQPFFMALGFVKPHLPFNAPKKYWDLYDADKINLANNPFVPKNAPEEAFTNWGELRSYYGMPKEGPMPDDLARKLIHGYYACVSYVDALVGKVLDELDRLDLRKNTIVILWGDHGWKLGEHGMWCKHTNFELDTHATLMLSAPGMKAKGERTRNLVEFVDIYPTLCELTGLEKPSHLEGVSMAPLLDEPDQPWKEAAYSQYPRGSLMGYSVRTDRYRYTEWWRLGKTEIEARELYDHEKDPDENANVAGEAENKDVVERHSALLKKGFGTIPR